MEFMLGCNYWCSNAGADMWRDFDIEAVKDDLKRLSSYGVTHMRVFPNWRDFQPVMPQFTAGGVIRHYCLEGDREPENPYYLDEVMMERFSQFLDVCDTYGISLVVGLITGWMSGRLYEPSALYGKNVITDPLAQHLEQLFIRGFVERFKDRKAIIAWDLGNECHCMAPANRFESETWTALISNAIMASDNTRPVISGLHGLKVEENAAWNIEAHALYTDILTTHPYPFWCEHTKIDEIASYRTTMHATAQNKLFSEIGGKPCMAEEIGTMGPMLCSNETAADFLRVNLYSLWANNSAGVMWWCANEQLNLSSFPYSDNMCETELGMFDKNKKAKPVLNEIKSFSEFLKNNKINLSNAQSDAVCILSHSQRQWGVGYMTYILLQNCGLNLQFAYCDNDLPESDTYLLPSVEGIYVMNKTKYEALLERVRNGATLYISLNNAILSEFESITGLKVKDSYELSENHSVSLGDDTFSFRRLKNTILSPGTAKVLAYDETGNPCISENTYGKGKVYFVNYPLEDNLIDCHRADYAHISKIYETIFEEKISKKPVHIIGNDLGITHHKTEDGEYCVIINHSEQHREFDIQLNNAQLEEVCLGSKASVEPFNVSILRFKYL